MSDDNISNLMDNFKNILNNSDNNSSSNSNNLNISPEMINNIANMLKNSNLNSSCYKNSNNTSNPSDFNEGFNFKDINNSDQNSNTSLDFETIMKIKSMMDTLNKKDDPRSNLLYSLKPYLRKSRQDKLDQYANLFKITQVANIFNFKKGDNK